MGRRGNRTAWLAGGALVAAVLGAPWAAAQEAPAAEAAASSDAQPAVGQIDFTDHQTVLRRSTVSVRSDVAQRFGPTTASSEEDQTEGPRRVELEFAAGDGDLDVSFAQRASLGSAGGDISHEGRGSEVRIGRGLVREDDRQQRNATYMFVASDDEALTWQPGQRSELGGAGPALQLQDRVTVGDMSVGVTYERNGVQASLAYVEREEQTTVGTQSFSQDESFAGVTVTMRR